MLSIAVGISYFLAARLSLALLTKPDGVAVFWPAAGLAAGVLIARGPGARWPVVAGAMAATIVANLLGDRNVWSAIVFSLCNAGEALLVAGIIEWYFGSSFNLGSLRHVLALLGAAIAGAAISGIGGTAGYILFHSSTAPILTIWYHWFASDALGIVTAAPLLIDIGAATHDPPPRREVFEGVVALMIVSLVSGLYIILPREPWTTVVPIALLFPLLLWLASSCRPAFTAAAAFVVAFTIVWTTTFGAGILGDASFPITERIVAGQAGILAISLCSLVIAALFAERRQHEAALMESETRLQQALTVGAVTAFDWDVRTGLSRRSDGAAEILGFDPHRAGYASHFLEQVHPDDQLRIKSLVRGVSPESPSYTVTFRFVRPDGREIWLEETSSAEFDTEGRAVRLKGLTLDITRRKQAEERQEQLIAELDHRVKNVLARVSVVAMQTRQSNSSIDEFVKALDGRIQSMAVAHTLLSQNRWHGVGLNDLVHQQLMPYATDTNTSISGPNIMLTAAITQALAMVLHELATNAAKYGALSTSDGRVSVIWDRLSNRDEEASLMIEWCEIDGPPIMTRNEPGYGTSLIRDLIPHELGGAVELVFPTKGVFCKIEFPLGRMSAIS